MKRLHLSWLWALLLVASAAYGGDAPDKEARAEGQPDKTIALQQLPATPLTTDALKFYAEMERDLARQLTQIDARPGYLRLFSARWCGYCRQAQAWLALHRVAYQNLDIDTREGMSEFVRTGKKGGIPLLIGPNVEVRGFSEAAYQRAFRIR